MPGKTIMKITGKIIIIASVLLFTFSAFGYFFWYKPKVNTHSENHSTPIKKNADNVNAKTVARMQQKALLAKDYVRSHEFDAGICFLIDMRLPSGKNRFFVYNLKEDSVEISGLVTHGSGSETDSDTLTFSNTANSHCTSLGRYRTGKPYNGRFGLAYKLYGLDETNSKAFDRFVVLHAHSCVPTDEQSSGTICVSYGCPTVAPAFLTQLKYYIDGSQRPILLWIYY